jgi:universal stress protein E
MRAILAASDLTARADRAVERAARLAAQFDVPLVVLHAVDDALPEPIAERREREALKAMRAQLDALPVRVRGSAKVAFGAAYEAILAEAADLGADLVVMGAHRKGWLRDLFVGSTADRALRAGRAPVLVAAARPTGPYRSAVVAVDFSVHSRRAAEFAASLAPGGALRLVHAFQAPRGLHGGGPPLGSSRREATALRRQFLAEMTAMIPASLAPGAQVETVVHAGEPEHVLRREVERTGADLLAHGRTGLPLAMLGSVAEGLLADPPCDVVAVRAW